MFPIIGSPFGPGGYGSFLDNFLKKIIKRRREIKRKKKLAEERRAMAMAMAMAMAAPDDESMTCDSIYL